MSWSSGTSRTDTSIVFCSSEVLRELYPDGVRFRPNGLDTNELEDLVLFAWMYQEAVRRSIHNSPEYARYRLDHHGLFLEWSTLRGFQLVVLERLGFPGGQLPRWTRQGATADL